LKEALDILEACLGILEKTRYVIPNGNKFIEVDEFHGKNKGLLIAEIELSDENEIFDKPAWLGAEVTGNPAYYNASLI
jgi:CYTH domain-containing protein